VTLSVSVPIEIKYVKVYKLYKLWQLLAKKKNFCGTRLYYDKRAVVVKNKVMQIFAQNITSHPADVTENVARKEHS